MALAALADMYGTDVDMGAGVRALLQAGARVDERQEIVCLAGSQDPEARVDVTEVAQRTPYTGPAYGRTAACVAATTKNKFAPGTFCTGACGVRVLQALLAGGADPEAVDGQGRKLCAHPELSPEAKAVLDAELELRRA